MHNIAFPTNNTVASWPPFFVFRSNTIHTVARRSHLNVDSVRVDVFSSERAERGRVRLCSVGVASLRRAALQCEVAVCRLYECVLAQAVERVLEAVQRPDMWVTVEPT